MDCPVRGQPALRSNRFVRGCLAVGFVPVLLLVMYFSSVVTVLFLDGAGWLPSPVRRCVGPMLGAPLDWYAESGLPGRQELRWLVEQSYTAGYSLR